MCGCVVEECQEEVTGIARASTDIRNYSRYYPMIKKGFRLSIIRVCHKVASRLAYIWNEWSDRREKKQDF